MSMPGERQKYSACMGGIKTVPFLGEIEQGSSGNK